MTKDHFKEPLPPGVKNLDNYEIDFPEHNLEDYVCYSNPQVQESLPYEKTAKEFYEKKELTMKQSDTNYDKEIKVDNLFIDADKHEERMNIMAEQENQYFKQEVTDDMLPDWMKDNESMYQTNPEDWTNDPEDPPIHWESEEK